jgi:hypothetical protein
MELGNSIKLYHVIDILSNCKSSGFIPERGINLAEEK